MKNAKFFRDKSARHEAKKQNNLRQVTLQHRSDTTNVIKINESLYKAIIKANLALSSVKDAILFTDAYGKIEFMNHALEEISGWKREDAYGLPVNKLFKIFDGNFCQFIADSDPLGDKTYITNIPRETILVKSDGNEISIEHSLSPIINTNGEFAGLVFVLHDTSLAKEINLKMAYLAQHDFLTNLPNRVLLLDRIGQAIATADRLGTQIALLFLDLDNFKQINDSYGHAYGDKLLQSVAKCLISCVRNTDTVSRQGGDEFIILLTENKESDDVTLTAEKILEAINLLNPENRSKNRITTSIGISIYPSDGKNAAMLIKNADIAMYHAKKMGGNNYHFFNKFQK